MSAQVKLKACAVALALMNFSILALAQTADQKPAKDDSNVLEEVVVTGSLLKSTAADESRPIVTLQAEDLLKSGATNPEQILKHIISNTPSIVSTATIGNGTAAGSYANLRSLGSTRTLVLLDGKRLVNNPFQSNGVDLNTVPTALIKEVQVLASGGSSTYGTDAIAGVVNFITSKELQGFSASATAITPEQQGGGQSFNANVSGGFGSLADNGWNIYGGLSYRKQIELRNPDRHATSKGYLPNLGVNSTQNRNFPANYTQSDVNGDTILTNQNPSAPGCTVGQYQVTISDTQCNYDGTQANDIMFPQEQWSGLVKGSLKVGDNHTASFEYVRGKSQVTTVVSPDGPNNLHINNANPYFPGNGITPAPSDPAFDPALPINFSWRDVELGQRIANADGYTDRALAELDGQIAGWDYQVSAAISTSVVSVTLLNGFDNVPALRSAFVNGGVVNGTQTWLNPFGPQTTDGLTLLQSVEINGRAQTSVGALKTYGVQVNRELFELPGGKVAIAFAADYKQEDSRLKSNHDITDALPNVFAGIQDVRGDRNSKGASFEAKLPLLKNLDLRLATRYDDYSDFGSTTNPEFGLNYKPAQWLTLRGSYSTAFRAPTLYNIFQPPTIDFLSAEHNDPLLCPGGVPDLAHGANEVRDCESGSQLTNNITGGNPNLKPEKSDAYTLGFTLKPFQSASFGVDYFNYHLKHTIGTLGDIAVFDNLSKYGNRIVRCQQVAQADRTLYGNCDGITDASLANPIAYVQDLLSNLGDTKTSGLDFTFDWFSEQTAWGTFGVRYNGTYITKYEYQREQGGAWVNRLGRTADFESVQRYVHTLSLSLDRGPMTYELTHSFRSAYRDCNEDCLVDVEPQFIRTVSSFQTYDLSATYRMNAHFTIFGTVQNLTNQAPPFTNGGNTQAVNWDDRYASILGRTYLLTGTYKF